MPAKYHIHTTPTLPKHRPVGKYGIVDWREDCSSCHNCVKRECAYSVYNDERDRLQGAVDYVDYLYECKGCLCCVQTCTKGLLSWQVNPGYLAMGDDVCTGDIISTTWYQAETGRVPVSGAGYRGPFKGKGFDGILTDMSEIVRPTRDGIHGREYISTSVDVGRKQMSLQFDANGGLITECPTLVEIPIPIVFNMIPWHTIGEPVQAAMLDAANELGTFAITDNPTLSGQSSACPHSGEQTMAVGSSKLAEWADSPNVASDIKKAKSSNPSMVAIVRIPFGPKAAERAIELAGQGVDGIHLTADWRGFVKLEDRDQHVTDAIRQAHLALVEKGIRDSITLIASGGIFLAEHVVKALLCGADMVAVDVPLMIALECRVCGNCGNGIACPIGFQDIDRDYAKQRIINLMGSWHSQLLELMGAMGIREARRLRGEVGRAMFFDDLERECFGPIFGERKAEVK